MPSFTLYGKALPFPASELTLKDAEGKAQLPCKLFQISDPNNLCLSGLDHLLRELRRPFSRGCRPRNCSGVVSSEMGRNARKLNAAARIRCLFRCELNAQDVVELSKRKRNP